MILQRFHKHRVPISWFFIFLFHFQVAMANHRLVGMDPGNEGRRISYGSSAGGLTKLAKDWAARTLPEKSTIPFDLKHKPEHIQPKLEMIGGPSQPEMQNFQSVNANNMVDLFSGDFSYNIPLMDVGGYPINIGYRGGVSMDQEASWVGLGFNINPGTISRNMRGLPDDFDGADSIRKVTSIKENKTIGVTAGADVEFAGFPATVGASLGVFHNNYKGWGIENGVNASINAGAGSKGALTGGLSLTNNSQEGLTITPSLSIVLSQNAAGDMIGATGSFGISAPYNTRSGMKGLQLSGGVKAYAVDGKNQRGVSLTGGSTISFASPSILPTITMPITSNQFSFTAKVGGELESVHPSFYVSGYVSKQQIAPADTLFSLPAYGYLYSQDGAANPVGLLDFNHEKEMIYRDKPAMPHIAVPFYTYDAFSITGEGTGGMFRAYRGDIGMVHDHFMRTKDGTDAASVDVGVGDLAHAGVDLNVNRAFTQNAAWTNENTMQSLINFKKNNGFFEAAYFRNPGEKSINSKKFYDSLGGDDVVAVKLSQAGNSSSSILATNFLNRYRNKQLVGNIRLSDSTVQKTTRDKRTQVISYLTAQEAGEAGLSKYIENYTLNQFALNSCTTGLATADEATGSGLLGEYFPSQNVNGAAIRLTNANISFNWVTGKPLSGSPLADQFPSDHFSIRWTGRIKPPTTGTYQFVVSSDDGARLWINDSLILNNWHDQEATSRAAIPVNLVAGQFYKIRLEYYEDTKKASATLVWILPGTSAEVIVPGSCLYPPEVDSIKVNDNLILEKRLNAFRKPNHLSEIDVLNADGRKYVYGLPVYNLLQKEATFASNSSKGNLLTGLSGYTKGIDNTTRNPNGKDNYFSSETTPAYAHSFLLTGIVSPDYVDVTGNGISDDDLGDAIKFDYSKVSGIHNPFKWRAPYNDSATYNEGLKTDNRDDKSSYVYGEKELWYLHAISSKTMIATFTVENRTDLYAIDENGTKTENTSAKRLKEINLYNKADLLKNGSAAVPVKTVHFDYSYELCAGLNGSSSGKLTLKKIWFTYNGNELKVRENPYVFHYHKNNPSYAGNAYDRWGNYKDPSQNPGARTGHPVTNAEYPYALQDSATAAYNASAWSLDSIFLPSGGVLKIDLESDDYAYVQNRRAMQLFKIKGFGADSSKAAQASDTLYNKSQDNLFIFVNTPLAATSKADVFQKYLAGVDKIYFKVFTRMPSDQYGSGYEYVTGYADLDTGRYGRVDDHTIWIKIKGINLAGDGDGSYSSLAKVGIQFLRLNLPSKAYPGSEVGDNIDAADAVRMIFSLADNIASAFKSFDQTARNKWWCSTVDTSKSYVRLDNPNYKKIGGGQRVKRITLYDAWDKMTDQRAATYGQEYTYTDQQMINGVETTISSGVASYEPMLGNEENPFHQPIEYVEKLSVMGPVTLGYSEEPLGESLFPSAGIGYSKVRVRSINYKNKKSANGYEETSFYTARDFPTYTDRSMLDDDNKKRYKPALSNFLRINAKYYLTLSQGFKVELNDMHGKIRSQATYAETDAKNPVTYTENIYKVVNANADNKVLANSVTAIGRDGSVDTTALIGKDVELMVDMREQLSVTTGNNVNLNVDVFPVPWIPFIFPLPSFIDLPQREETRFRSVATLKVIQRYGILDSVIHVDKGSKVVSKDLAYDAETGDVILTRTQNEFNDPVYSFNYPNHWAYDGMGLAYKNIDLRLDHIYMRSGKIVSGLPLPDSVYFSGGDELLILAKLKTGDSAEACHEKISSFPVYGKLWAVDTSKSGGGAKSFYFIDKDGVPYTGYDISLRVIRSGRRNINQSAGTVTSLSNPLVWNPTSHKYELSLGDSSRLVNASASEFKETWKVEDRKLKTRTVACTDSIPADCGGGTSCTCTCLKTLFDYLIKYRKLFIQPSDTMSVARLVQQAVSAGYSINIADCPILQKNAGKYFYALTSDSIGTSYSARIGNCVVSLNTSSNISFYNLVSQTCNGTAVVHYLDSADRGRKDTLDKIFYGTRSFTHYVLRDTPVNHAFASVFPVDRVDTSTQKLISANYTVGAPKQGFIEYTTIGSGIKFDSMTSFLATNPSIQSATLKLFAAPSGLHSPQLPNAHTPNTKTAAYSIVVPYDDWDYSTGSSVCCGDPYFGYEVTSAFQDLTVDATDFVNAWKTNGNFGLFLSNNLLFDSLTYTTFGSQRYPDTSKRPRIIVRYLNPEAAVTDSITGTLQVVSCQTCDTIIGNTCKSAVTDTAFNPYIAGVLGNWREFKKYTYYNQRTETDPSTATNIRIDGTFRNFKPFWLFSGGSLKPQYDTIRWVWNQQSTLFNRKGSEIENKDPLGRYNTGLYGYQLTLPIAVVQNSQYRESAFDGFEDYGYTTLGCDTSCPAFKHFDFSEYQAKISTEQKHSGKSSLKLMAHDQASLSYDLVTLAQDTAKTAIQVNTFTDSCSGKTALRSLKTAATILQPAFSPFAGKEMVVSAWVKELQTCNCVGYTRNQIVVTFNDASTTTFTFKPTGNIIEGWQRYEGVFTSPATATQITLSLQSTDTATVFFDDFRIHPFNANMKSFIYHPVTLRLMAELDENNYSSFYEYDDDGTLIRVKKETERGIQTIKESRSALIK